MRDPVNRMKRQATNYVSVRGIMCRTLEELSKFNSKKQTIQSEN